MELRNYIEVAMFDFLQCALLILWFDVRKTK